MPKNALAFDLIVMAGVAFPSSPEYLRSPSIKSFGAYSSSITEDTIIAGNLLHSQLI